MIAVVPSDLVAAMAQLEEDATAYILGTQDEARIAVWSMSSAPSVTEMLPSGLRVLGVVVLASTSLDEKTLRTQLASQLHDLATTTAYALIYESENRSLRMLSTDPEVPPIPVTVVATPGHCASPFTAAIEYGIVRCFATLDVTWTTDERDRRMAARAAIDEHLAALRDPEATYFELPSGDIASQAGDVVHAAVASRGKRAAWSLAEIVVPNALPKKPQRANDGWDDAPKKKKPTAPKQAASEDVRYGRVCYVELLTSMTPMVVTAPVITSSLRDRLSITLDVVCCVPTRSSLALMLQTLADGLFAQLRESKKHLLPDTRQMRCHQFPLQNGAMHPVAAWSLDGHEIPQSARDHLHTLFYQPLHPTFLPACAWSLSRTQPPSDVLLNVHVGVSKGAGGTQFLVSGDYAFYHYMQQGINDKGWGCAYRSLQTLASWLVFNRYTSVPVPTHREIQETLVHIGDKPPRFLGSSDWIGSIEVGFVLDERYGITFRSLSCASGADLPSRAHDLALHFESQGTPVMMGGASMAYTVLGVDIHASTGDVAYLILDPHYTGPDDLVTIQTKTVSLEGFKGVACGWRKTTSFAPGSFYNFCLPQRPELH